MIVVKPLQAWAKYDREATRHGWSLFDHKDTVAIAKIDDSDMLQDDQEALHEIVGRASQGDQAALLALYLDGRLVVKDVDIPPCLEMSRNRRLFLAAVEGLYDYYPDLRNLKVVAQIEDKVQVPDTGNHQLDYEQTRDQVERIIREM